LFVPVVHGSTNGGDEVSEIIIDGILIDDETGEILGEVPGRDKAAYAVREGFGADLQLKEWNTNRAIRGANIIRHQSVKSEKYGDLRASIRQQNNTVLDVAGFKEWVAETELSRDDLLALVMSSTAGNWRTPWKIDQLPEHLQDAMKDMQSIRSGAPFVVIEMDRKQAPKVTTPDTLLDDLERSLEMAK
jgi:hypothetical protein